MNLVESLKAFFLGSGATWVLWFLLALAAASLVVVVERALYFRGRGGDLAVLSRGLEERLAAGDLGGARSLARGSRSVAAAVAAAGLRVAHLGPTSAEKTMQGACAVERERLESRLAFLGTLGNNAPFVGLFGTVIGVIQAFEQLGAGGASGQAVSSAVMAGIAEALIATAVGIGVALPAVAFYNHFQRRIARLLAGTEAVSNVVFAHLCAEAPLGAGLAPERAQAETETVRLSVDRTRGVALAQEF